MSEPLWTPDESRIAATEITRFCKYLEDRAGVSPKNGAELRDWVEQDQAAFWSALWDFCGVIGDRGDGPVMTGDTLTGARFFPDARLNFAENMLELAGPRDDAAPAIVFRGEDKASTQWSWGELRAQVSRLQQSLRDLGVGEGDRVAAILPNRPEAIAAMLATVSLGATWCSVSPDFGVRAILDRFEQLSPKALFAVDGYYYAGKRIDIAEKLGQIVPRLDTVERVIVVDYLGHAQTVAEHLENGVTYHGVQSHHTARHIDYARVPFDHPLYILFSSGTTGAPKCIVHRSGGVLLQHIKEHTLHADIKQGDRVFYFTTLGWMMWNWLVSALMRGATVMLFDGSPFHPRPNVLWDYAEQEKFTHFGTSAKYIDSLRKAGVEPKKTHDLGALRTLMSTGSPLLPSGFEYVYEQIKDDLHLASISGGTDIVSCFVIGDPTAPVYTGEIQGAAFGMSVDVWAEDGTPAPPGQKGELVCTRPFPSVPLGFWGDEDGSRFHKAYFDKFEGVWCQGDFAERTEHGGFIIHGRSDATLNPGGVRIGTAEIYAEVEKFEEVLDSVVIGHDQDGDQRVVLFVVMADGQDLADDLIKRIKTAIRTGSSPRHVPAEIIAVADIPRTKSGKVSELAVRDVVHGREVRNTGALANPESLDGFRGIL